MLDASFVLALLDGEAAAQRFAPLLGRAEMPSVTVGEVFSKLHAAAGLEPTVVEAGLRALGIRLVDLPVAAARRFPALRELDAVRRAQQRAAGDRPLRVLSLGDLCCLGYAIEYGRPVLTGDRHWRSLGLTVEVVDFRDPEYEP